MPGKRAPIRWPCFCAVCAIRVSGDGYRCDVCRRRRNERDATRRGGPYVHLGLECVEMETDWNIRASKYTPCGRHVLDAVVATSAEWEWIPEQRQCRRCRRADERCADDEKITIVEAFVHEIVKQGEYEHRCWIDGQRIVCGLQGHPSSEWRQSWVLEGWGPSAMNARGATTMYEVFGVDPEGWIARLCMYGVLHRNVV